VSGEKSEEPSELQFYPGIFDDSRLINQLAAHVGRYRGCGVLLKNNALLEMYIKENKRVLKGEDPFDSKFKTDVKDFFNLLAKTVKNGVPGLPPGPTSLPLKYGYAGKYCLEKKGISYPPNSVNDDMYVRKLLEANAKAPETAVKLMYPATFVMLYAALYQQVFFV